MGMKLTQASFELKVMSLLFLVIAGDRVQVLISQLLFHSVIFNCNHISGLLESQV